MVVYLGFISVLFYVEYYLVHLEVAIIPFSYINVLCMSLSSTIIFPGTGFFSRVQPGLQLLRACVHQILDLLGIYYQEKDPCHDP